jgi:poly(3-hydroxybutyrate) depolymerase
MRTTLALLVLAVLAAPASAKDAPPKAGEIHDLVTKEYERNWSLYVPSAYTPKVSWPLVISSHGRGGTGKGEMGQWTGLAKSGGFIVACPDMCNATVDRPPKSKLTPAEEDDKVVLEIIASVGEWFRLNRRAVMITGFSGGGNPSYYSGLRHPDLITHICTRGGNFAPQWIPQEKDVIAAGKDRLEIFIFYGEHDHPLILGEGGNPGQAKQAYEALTQAGYGHVAIEEVPGMKHESRAKKAAEWFGAYLAENRKLFAAGDQADALLDDAREAAGKNKHRDAIRALLKLADLEEKRPGLRPQAKDELRKLDEVAMKIVAEARAAHEGGDDTLAQKLLSRVARDFRGLPAAEAATKLKKEWGK